MTDQLQSPYFARSKAIFSSETAAKLSFGDISKLGYSGVARLQNETSSVPQFLTNPRHSSSNNERLLPILDSVRYHPYPTFNNVARIRQLYAYLDAANSSKAARALPE